MTRKLPQGGRSRCKCIGTNVEGQWRGRQARLFYHPLGPYIKLSSNPCNRQYFPSGLPFTFVVLRVLRGSTLRAVDTFLYDLSALLRLQQQRLIPQKLPVAFQPTLEVENVVHFGLPNEALHFSGVFPVLVENQD